MSWLRPYIRIDGIKVQRKDARILVEEAQRLARLRPRKRRWGFNAAGFALLFGTAAIVGTTTPSLSPPLSFIVAMVFGAVSGLGIAWWWRWQHRRELRLAMRLLDHHLCEQCGYWLRGLGDDVKQCPECGAEREPLSSKIEP